jgi:hypothetical protein
MNVSIHRPGIVEAPVQPERAQHVHVLLTSVPSTLAALRTAARCAADLGATIEVLVPQVVSYALPLNRPPVDTRHLARRLAMLFDGRQVQTAVRIFLCRDPMIGISAILPKRSLIVVGISRSWWPWPQLIAARKLRRLGHHVIVCQENHHHA